MLDEKQRSWYCIMFWNLITSIIVSTPKSFLQCIISAHICFAFSISNFLAFRNLEQIKHQSFILLDVLRSNRNSTSTSYDNHHVFLEAIHPKGVIVWIYQQLLAPQHLEYLQLRQSWLVHHFFFYSPFSWENVWTWLMHLVLSFSVNQSLSSFHPLNFQNQTFFLFSLISHHCLKTPQSLWNSRYMTSENM